MTARAVTESPTADSDKTVFGFWVYLMTDCVLFASLFAAYAVLHTQTFGGEPAKELFSLPFVLAETLLLLTSSFTSGLAILAAHRGKRNQVLAWLAVTALLGISFLTLEISEFATLVHEGAGPDRSAFLSSFFTLVGTHGAHITAGLLWLSALAAVIIRKGLGGQTVKRLTLFTLFWHFLDIVWIFIFTIVYLFGALGI